MGKVNIELGGLVLQVDPNLVPFDINLAMCLEVKEELLKISGEKNLYITKYSLDEAQPSLFSGVMITHNNNSGHSFFNPPVTRQNVYEAVQKYACTREDGLEIIGELTKQFPHERYDDVLPRFETLIHLVNTHQHRMMYRD